MYCKKILFLGLFVKHKHVEEEEGGHNGQFFVKIAQNHN
jgi:hypothetical protein